jgi:hypothetical protein
MAARGITWNTREDVERLRQINGAVHEGRDPGLGAARARHRCCEVILALAPETNGERRGEGVGGAGAEDRPRSHAHLALPKEDEKIRFRDLLAQPRKIISSPIWSGLESEKVCYNAGYTNVHELIPWRTLTGRQQLYQDHLWMRAFGEALCRLQAAARPEDHLGEGPQAERRGRDRAQLHHPAPEVGHPLHLYRQPADADTEPRRAGGLALGNRRAEGRHPRQRLGRGLQCQRRPRRPRGGVAAHPRGDTVHVPRAGEDREHPRLGDHRPARWHPQLL